MGLRPKHPHIEAGIRIDPPVSEPRAIGATPAATAAPDPPLEPPVMCSGFHGFPVRSQAETRFVPPAASSCMFVFPSSTTPVRRTAPTMAESRLATLPVYAAQQPVVSCPATSKRSLIAMGTPVSGWRASGGTASARPASSRASSAQICENARVDDCHVSARRSDRSTSSAEETSPARIAETIAAAVSTSPSPRAITTGGTP